MGIPHTPWVPVRRSSKGRQGLGEHEGRTAWPGAYTQLFLPAPAAAVGRFLGAKAEERKVCLWEVLCRRQAWLLPLSHPGSTLPTCVLFAVLLWVSWSQILNSSLHTRTRPWMPEKNPDSPAWLPLPLRLSFFLSSWVFGGTLASGGCFSHILPPGSVLGISVTESSCTGPVILVWAWGIPWAHFPQQWRESSSCSCRLLQGPC